MRSERSGFRRVLALGLQAVTALAFAAALTLALFFLLPFLEQVGRGPDSEMDVRAVSTASLPPPPPPSEAEVEKKEKEEEAEPPPQELSDEAAPLDLSQLELALNPGVGDGSMGNPGARLAALDGAGAKGEDADAVFSIEDLDQSPRVVYQPSPEYPTRLRKKKVEGTVHVLFVVDCAGRVTNPFVQRSTDAAFEQPALQAVRRWRFEPGKRNGQHVQFRMRVPITFMCG